MLMRIVRVGAFAALVLYVPSSAWAQAGRTAVNGTVFDQANAVLPGATVTATKPGYAPSGQRPDGPHGSTGINSSRARMRSPRS